MHHKHVMYTQAVHCPNTICEFAGLFILIILYLCKFLNTRLLVVVEYFHSVVLVFLLSSTIVSCSLHI